MSSTIDQKVVEMRFDNRQFESNVSTTMSTLDKLKQKLNLTGAAKGFDDIGRAAKNVDMSGLGRGVEQVGLKFNAMYTIADQALRNITNRVQQTAERMVKALTIDPVKTGFQEYETQIKATQTILANTKSKGSTIDDVNKALEELNRYADLTIYNFTEMTRNIGTFTAAGIDLETSVSAIQGIANLAAVSGSTSQQASTAMYQLSQALAAGTIRLMDWNSVVNAGMGGEIFQNALKQTSKELNTGAEAAIKAKGSFRESLSAGWLTAEVLTNTLKKFTTSGANEYVAKYIEQSPEVVEAALKEAEATYDEAEAIEKASEALANKYGKNKDEIKQALEFAKTAEDAATKVKTFTQLWDVLKEAAQSGWAMTWKMLVGDFEQAKNLITPIADTMVNFINKISDARNAVIQSAFAMKLTALLDAVKNGVQPIKDAADSVKEVTKSVEDYANVVNEIIRGNWGNGQARWNKLTEAGYDWAHAQNLVNEKLGSSVRHATDYAEAQEGITESQDKVNQSTNDYIAELTKLSDAELKNLGYIDEQIEALRRLADMAERTGIPIEEFLEKIDQIDGRFLFINSFKNLADSFVDVGKVFAKAWQTIFPPKSTEEKAESLFNILASMYGFTKKLSEIFAYTVEYETFTKDGEKVTKTMTVFTETGLKLLRTLKGIFSVIDLITTVVGGGLKFALQVASSVLEYFHLDILDVTAAIGDALVAFNEWFQGIFNISDGISVIIPIIIELGQAIWDWFASLKESEGVQKLIGSFTKLFEFFRAKGLSGVLEAIATAFVDIAETIKEVTGIDFVSIGTFIFEGLKEGLLVGGKSVLEFIASMATMLIDKFCELLGIHSPSTVFMELGKFIIDGLNLGLKEGIGVAPETIKAIVSKCIEIVRNIDWSRLFAIGATVTGLLIIKRIGDTIDRFTKILQNFSAPFAGIGQVLNSMSRVVKSFEKITKAAAFNINMKAIKHLAISLAILTGCIIAIVKIAGDDYEKLTVAYTTIAGLAGVLVLLAFAMSKLSDASVSWEKGKGLNINGIRSSLLSIGLAIGVLAVSVKLIGDMDKDASIRGFFAVINMLGAILVLMTAFVGVTQVFKMLTKSDISENISKVGSMMLKLSIALLLMAGVCKLAGKLSPDDMTNGLKFLVAVGVFVGVLTAIGKSSGNNIGKVGTMMRKLVVSMALMVGICKLAAKLKVSEMIKGGIFAFAIGKFVKTLVNVTKIGKKQQIAKLGGLLVAISASMALMVGVCKLVAKLTPDEMIKGGLFVLAFTGFVWALVKVTTIASDKQIAKVSATILAISLAVGILALVSMAISFLSFKDIAKGIFAIGVLGATMALMIRSLKGAQNVTSSLIAMTAAMTLMAIAAASISVIPEKDLRRATACMAILMSAFALMTKSVGAFKKVNHIVGPLITLTVVVGLLAAILWGLSVLDVKASLENAGSLAILMATMAGVLFAIKKMNITDVESAAKGIGLLTGMIIPMLTFVYVLKQMNGLETSAKNVVVLAGLMYAMTGIIAAMSAIGKFLLTDKKAMEGMALGIIALIAIFVPMLLFVNILSKLSGIAVATDNVLALIGLMYAMTGLIAILAVIGALIGSAGPVAAIGAGGGIVAGIVALCAMWIPMAIFINILKKLEGIDVAKDNVTCLVGLMYAMTGLIAILGVVGWGIIGALLGMASLYILGKTMGGFIDIIKRVSGVDMASENVIMLMDMMSLMTKLLMQLAIIGPFALVGLVALGALILMIAGVAAVAVAVGALFELCPQLQDFLNTGLPVLEQLAEGMGRMIGKFIGAIGEELGDSLIKIGDDIVVFAGKIKEASEISGGIDGSKFQGIRDMVDILGDIGWTTFGTTVSDFLTTGGSSLERFASDGKKLFQALKEIGGEAEGFTFPENFSAKSVITLIDAIKAVSWAMADVSIADLFATSKNEEGAKEGAMEKFKNDGVKFFEAMKDIGDAAKDFSFPADFNFGGLSTLLEALKDVANRMIGMSISDIFSKIVGDGGTIEKFKKDGIDFFKAMTDIGLVAKNFTFTDDFDVKGGLKKLFAVLESVADYTKGATWDSFLTTGGSTIDRFKTDGLGLFAALQEISNSYSGISLSSINIADTAIGKIRGIIDRLKNVDYSGVAEFTGIGFMQGGIGADGPMHDIGVALKDFGDQVAWINISAVETSVKAADDIVSIIYRLAGLDSSGVALFNPKPVGEKIKAYSDSVLEIRPSSISSSISAANSIVDFIASLASLNVSGVLPFRDAIANLSYIPLDGFVESFNGISSGLIDVGQSLIDELSGGIKSAQGLLVSAAASAMNRMIEAIESKTEIFKNAGMMLATKFSSGISTKYSTIRSMIGNGLSELSSTINGYYDSFYSAGSYVAIGFANGISENSYQAVATASAMALAAKNAAEEALGINSPSKVFYQIGDYVGQGFTNALGDYDAKTFEAGASMADYARKGLSNAISRINDVIGSDMDTQPTIRPVLDLSNVQTGAAAINGLFSNGVSVGAMSNVRSISSIMAGRNQNGSNADVISAINRLNDSLANAGGDTYSINGITYDDGSNISTAIKDIVREARMERRR